MRLVHIIQYPTESLCHALLECVMIGVHAMIHRALALLATGERGIQVLNALNT